VLGIIGSSPIKCGSCDAFCQDNNAWMHDKGIHYDYCCLQVNDQFYAVHDPNGLLNKFKDVGEKLNWTIEEYL